MVGIGGSDRWGGYDVEIFGIPRSAGRPVHRSHQGNDTVYDDHFGMSYANASIDPDRYASLGKWANPTLAFAGRRSIGYQLDIDSTLPRPDECLDDPGASGDGICTREDLMLGTI